MATSPSAAPPAPTARPASTPEAPPPDAHVPPASTPLADLALLTLVIAHGTDADLDPRETRALVHQLDLLSDAFGDIRSGADLSDLVEAAVEAYGEIRVVGLDEVVGRLGAALDEGQRARAHAALVEVADADGVFHTMEKTLLRHIAQAWRLE